MDTVKEMLRMFLENFVVILKILGRYKEMLGGGRKWSFKILWLIVTLSSKKQLNMQKSIWRYVYILKGENELFHIRMRKKINYFYVVRWFRGLWTNDDLAEMGAKNPKFWHFFTLM